ncbi:SDR family NAD(P)-dependent oxidoreductase [Chloroflexota bacterium]
MGILDGKVAIITGAGRGIGRAIALRFAGEGADVVIDDIFPERIEAVTQEIKKLGRNYLAVRADVSLKKEVESLVSATVSKFKKIDILVNNAGITRHAPLLEMAEEDWDDVIDVNLKGVFLCTQAVAKYMVEQRSGKIMSLASITGIGGADGTMANYAASKAGIIALTKVAARALGGYGINVNAIAPGTIMTDITRTRRSPEELEVFVKSREEIAALGKVGEVADIAAVALFLASDEASFIHGTVISSDGGRFDKL